MIESQGLREILLSEDDAAIKGAGYGFEEFREMAWKDFFLMNFNADDYFGRIESSSGYKLENYKFWYEI